MRRFSNINYKGKRLDGKTILVLLRESDFLIQNAIADLARRGAKILLMSDNIDVMVELKDQIFTEYGENTIGGINRAYLKHRRSDDIFTDAYTPINIDQIIYILYDSNQAANGRNLNEVLEHTIDYLIVFQNHFKNENSLFLDLVFLINKLISPNADDFLTVFIVVKSFEKAKVVKYLQEADMNLTNDPNFILAQLIQYSKIRHHQNGVQLRKGSTAEDLQIIFVDPYGVNSIMGQLSDEMAWKMAQGIVLLFFRIDLNNGDYIEEGKVKVDFFKVNNEQVSKLNKYISEILDIGDASETQNLE